MKYFKLPDLGEGLAEAEIVEWHVNAGEEVEIDQLLVSVETAKAIVEVPSPSNGVIARLFGQAGDIIHTGATLVEFEGQDDDAGTVVGKIESHNGDTQDDHFIIGSGATKKAPFVMATPAIRDLADRLRVNLSNVQGSGRHGMITRQDVERSAALTTQIHGNFESLRGVRRSMAKNMSYAQAEVAKVTLHDDAIIHAWEQGTDVTMRLVHAIGSACTVEQNLNCWFNPDNLSRQLMSAVDLGIAVDTPDGLFVPVLRNVTERSLQDLRQGLDQLRADVKARKIPPKELQGATISFSNFGTIAGRYADPVVVPPMVAIVGAGKIRQELTLQDDTVVQVPVLPLSVSFDHRVVTGGEAARFMAALIADLQSKDCS